MVANIVLNASTTAASGTSLDIASAAEVLMPTSRPLGPNGFTQLMRVVPFITPAAESAAFTSSQGTARNSTLAKPTAPGVEPDRALELRAITVRSNVCHRSG